MTDSDTDSKRPDDVWSLYVVRCRDATLYAGVTTDVERRMDEHRAGRGKGAKYLRGRAPLELVLSREVGDRSLALKLERRFKRLRRKAKLQLVETPELINPWVDEAASTDLT